MLKGKHIILGITGSIAAYKAAHLVRLLVKNGAEVRVLMSQTAKEFITPLTMATLAKHPVLVDFFNPENGDWNSHVELGLWADLYLIAPATASTMAKMSAGIADNLLLTTYLSARCPIAVAPAMDLDMYRHVTTQRSLQELQRRGVTVLEPTSGELASGLDGKGRMQEPEDILHNVVQMLYHQQQLANCSVLVTAGPTYESIDAVRFIGNYSSGRMGYAIAEELASRGAAVHLVSGPVSVTCSHPNITLYKVTTARQMYEHAIRIFPQVQAGVMAAAVADFTPQVTAHDKIKRKGDNLTLTLVPTQDIAKALGQIKTPEQRLVGFALETNNEQQNAQRKLEDKNLDFIVLNSLRDQGAGFNVPTNKISILRPDTGIEHFPLKSKQEVAIDIVDALAKLL